MPLTPTNYLNSVIYKIEHNEKPELLYIGSTTNFIKRKYSHKNNCNDEKKKEYNFKLYRMMRDNGNWEAFKIMIIKEYSCNNKTELLIEEEKHRKGFQATLNSHRAHRTNEEYKKCKSTKNKKYRENNKEKIQEHKKEYYEENKEKIKEKDNKYRENNKEEINKKCREYREENKEEILQKEKQYREDNKEKIKEYQKKYNEVNKEERKEQYKKYNETNKEKRKEKEKEYRANNKEQIKEKAKEKAKEKINCLCGSIFCKDRITRHEKTKKKKLFLNQLLPK